MLFIDRCSGLRQKRAGKLWRNSQKFTPPTRAASPTTVRTRTICSPMAVRTTTPMSQVLTEDPSASLAFSHRAALTFPGFGPRLFSNYVRVLSILLFAASDSDTDSDSDDSESDNPLREAFATEESLAEGRLAAAQRRGFPGWSDSDDEPAPAAPQQQRRNPEAGASSPPPSSLPHDLTPRPPASAH